MRLNYERHDGSGAPCGRFGLGEKWVAFLDGAPFVSVPVNGALVAHTLRSVLRGHLPPDSVPLWAREWAMADGLDEVDEDLVMRALAHCVASAPNAGCPADSVRQWLAASAFACAIMAHANHQFYGVASVSHVALYMLSDQGGRHPDEMPQELVDGATCAVIEALPFWMWGALGRCSVVPDSTKAEVEATLRSAGQDEVAEIFRAGREA
jgi:hypothetical protein